jgi:hypothetical protein
MLSAYWKPRKETIPRMKKSMEQTEEQRSPVEDTLSSGKTNAHTIQAAWYDTRLDSCLTPDGDPPFCPSRMLVCANDGALTTLLLPIDLACSIALLLLSFQHAWPHSGFDPPRQAARTGAPWARV